MVCRMDVPALLTLEELLFPNAMAERMLEHEVGRGWGWVEEIQEGRIVGYALVRSDGPLLDLTRLGVDPTHQGRGVGKRLLEKVLEDGRDIILTVKKNNAHAIGLYRKYNFEIVGHLASANAWVMRFRAASP